MSAPRRRNTSGPTSSTNDARVEWLASFRRNVRELGTAHKAWNMLVNAGLEEKACLALWRFAHPPAAYIERAQGELREINRKIKALSLANKQATERANDRRATLFSERVLQKYKDVLNSRMPFLGETVGEWAFTRVIEGKGIPDFAASRKAFVSIGARGQIADRKLWLFILQQCCPKKVRAVHRNWLIERK